MNRVDSIDQDIRVARPGDEAFPLDRADALPPMKGAVGERILRAAGPGVKLISFDVFDTVLTRKVGDPIAIFKIVGQKLRSEGLIRCSAEVFAGHRHECEQRVRGNVNCREVSLREIYEEMTCFHHEREKVNDYVAMEMEVEKSSIEVIPAMRDAVDVVRREMGRVIYVSDIYLPEDFLRELMEGLGLIAPGDGLYVSSHYGVQKRRRGLFEKVLEIEKLRPDALLHCGNSTENDILPAQKMGIRTFYFAPGNPNPSEEVLNRFADQTEGMSSLIAGAARQARLAGIELEDDLKSVWETGTTVTGPLVYLYALWIIERSRNLGLDRLLFLARDAFFPFLAVKSILQEHPEWGMEAHYVYGSRPTYYALGIEKLGEREWDALTGFSGQTYGTLPEIERCLMIKRETLEKHADKLGMESGDWDRRLSDRELKRVKSAILNEAEVNRDCFKDIQEYQDLKRRYLSESGVSAENRVALVDSGWTTRSHQPLHQFLVRMGCQEVRLLYIGLTVDETAVPLEKIETFIFNRATRQGKRADGMSYARPLESLFISHHGRTEGFLVKGGNIAPRFAPLENPEFIERFYSVYRAGVEKFLGEMGNPEKTADAFHDLRGVAEALISRFWTNPTVEEARSWSRLSWEWDPLGSRKLPLARAYEWRDVVEAFRQGKWPECHPQFWSGGARMLSSPSILRALRGAILLRSQFNRLVRKLPASLRERLKEMA